MRHIPRGRRRVGLSGKQLLKIYAEYKLGNLEEDCRTMNLSFPEIEASESDSEDDVEEDMPVEQQEEEAQEEARCELFTWGSGCALFCARPPAFQSVS